jgi:hypothetical protein
MMGELCDPSVASLNPVYRTESLGVSRSTESLNRRLFTKAICSDASEAPVEPGDDATVIFSWEEDPGGPVDEYIVEVGTAPGLSDVGTYHTGSQDTSYALTLDPGTYYARARAVIDGVTGDPSDEDTFTV